MSIADNILQFCMAAFGLTALWLAFNGKARRARRWAPVIGLLGQPFWFYFAWQQKSWGVLMLVIAYTFVYLNGVVRYRGMASDEENSD